MEHVNNILDSIDKDVQLELSKMGPDIILLLMEKWDRDLEQLALKDKLTVAKLLDNYVFLKLCFHHLKCREHDVLNDLGRQLWIRSDDKLTQLDLKIKEARKKYYVAKQRNETHQPNCNCRGCRCIGQLSP